MWGRCPQVSFCAISAPLTSLRDLRTAQCPDTALSESDKILWSVASRLQCLGRRTGRDLETLLLPAATAAATTGTAAAAGLAAATGTATATGLGTLCLLAATAGLAAATGRLTTSECQPGSSK